MNAGLNLFSIRDLIQTEEDFLTTAQKLKEMGYSTLQYSGAPLDPMRLKRVSEATGLPVVLTHVPMQRVVEETTALMDDHAIFGCKNIGIGMMPFEMLLDADKFKKTVDDLNVAGEKMQQNGFKFFYHHHHFEFANVPGENYTAIDYILANAPYINFTADTHWIQRGGADVCDMLRKMKGRVGCVHFKDYKIAWNEEKSTYDSYFAPVGDGNLNFHKIAETVKEIGTEYVLVEQDDACKFPNALELVERSIKYIKNEL